MPSHRLAPATGPSGRGLLARGGLLLVAVLVVGAFLRLWHAQTAYELFIDEVTYSDIALSVARGDGVRLHDEPFHLHPAAFFGTLALAVRVLGLQDQDLAEVAWALRPVPAAIGALTPVLVAVVVRVVSRSWWAAAAAGALLALDPFLIRFDTRVLLESQAMALASAGLLGLLLVQRRESAGRDARAAAVGAGVLMAGSLLTKETYAFVTVLPLLVLLAGGLVLRRRSTGTVLAVVLLLYGAYVGVVAAVGQLPTWLDQKTRGVQRLLGLVQETGFNAGDSPGLLDRILANLAGLGVTYGLIGGGAVATVGLFLALRRHRDDGGGDDGGGDDGGGDDDGHRDRGTSRPGAVLLVVWSACAYAHLGYALTIGTLEEQMFYLLVVTGVPVLCVAVGMALGAVVGTGAGRGPRRTGAGLRAVLVVVLGAALVVEATVWWGLRTVPDDGYARFFAWERTGLPDGARLATTEELTQFVLDDRLVVRVETTAELEELGAEHVLVVSELLDQGYSRADPGLRALIADGEVVYSTRTRTLGTLQVVAVPPAASATG